MIRGIAAAIGVILLLYAFVPAASTASDAEISNQSSTHMDEFALSLAQLSTTIGSFVPVIAAGSLVILFMKAAT